ncbi:MAG: AMP-binding protein, partial [Mycobacterium sp.]
MLPALARVLDGHDSALVPVPAGADRRSELSALRVGDDIDDDIALVVTTSGTTGAPKGALLTAAALTASAAATHDRLGGPGRWLLALPPYHIAGVQVLVRSLLSGTVPVELDVSTGFDITEFASAVRELGSGRRYTALVAAQLAKTLTDSAATAALADLDAVLIGGGPAPRPLLDAAASAGITVVGTYGMSETAGGCVYDGVPLDGVRLRVDPDGRI